MKKLLFITVLSASLYSCGSTSTTITSQPEDSTTQQKKPDMLIGIQTKEAFKQTPYSSWFISNYDDYNPNSEVIENLKPLLKGIQIKAFMGTWCGDSKRETPSFYKILDSANYNYDNLELVTVDRSKTTPDGLEKGYDIVRVPTFIFYKNDQEIGRYVEYARENLEKDILAILSSQDYKHSYEDE